MFAYFKGNIEKKDDSKVVIDLNGIGYEIHMPAGDIDRLTLGELVKIHTFTDIKENYDYSKEHDYGRNKDDFDISL